VQVERRHAVAESARLDRRGRELGQGLLDRKLSRDAAHAEIAAIADPQLRGFARRHLTRQFAAKDMAQRKDYAAAFNAAFDALDRGAPIGDQGCSARRSIGRT